jgi:hypothetical protein
MADYGLRPNPPYVNPTCRCDLTTTKLDAAILLSCKLETPADLLGSRKLKKRATLA